MSSDQRLQLWPRPTAPAPEPLAIVTAVSPLPSIRPYAQAVVMIPNVPEGAAPALSVGPGFQFGRLAEFMRLGRTFHARASRGAFVEKVMIGYYAWERREEWRTCPLAAAYAGAFGPASVEKDHFSYTQAIYQLSGRIGYDLRQEVTDPTGARGPMGDRIVKLSDDHYWDVNGLAQWVHDLELSAVLAGGRFPGLSGAVTGRYVAGRVQNG